MKDIVVLGQGGFAKEVEFLISEINSKTLSWNFLGFVGPESKTDRYFGSDEYLKQYSENICVAIGIGDPLRNRNLIAEVRNISNLSFPNLIHPSAIMSNSVNMGIGNIICANNVFTVDLHIGNFNIFNLSCTYGHDAIIGDFNIFNPGVHVSGGVNLGDENLVGTNAAILQYLSIGNSNKIGAGTVITKNFDNNSTILGVPGKKV
jgi:sugar O-acyltransferase (sialic acid O-acetyltransferase NeuD family)